MVVIQARLAERLDHSAPAVSEMIRRLRDEGYVEVRGRSLSLTDAGPGGRRERGAQAPPGRAAADRHHRAAVGEGAPGGRTLGARHLRRGRGPPGRAPGPSDDLPPRQSHPRLGRIGTAARRRCPRAAGATTCAWSGSPSRWRSTSTRSPTCPRTASCRARRRRCRPGPPTERSSWTWGCGPSPSGPSLAQQLFVTAAMRASRRWRASATCTDRTPPSSGSRPPTWPTRRPTPAPAPSSSAPPTTAEPRIGPGPASARRPSA